MDGRHLCVLVTTPAPRNRHLSVTLRSGCCGSGIRPEPQQLSPAPELLAEVLQELVGVLQRRRRWNRVTCRRGRTGSAWRIAIQRPEMQPGQTVGMVERGRGDDAEASQ